MAEVVGLMMDVVVAVELRMDVVACHCCSKWLAALHRRLWEQLDSRSP